VKPLICLLVLVGTLAARAVNPTEATPVLSFKLPTFTKEGHRSMLLQGTEAVVSATRVELIEMNLTLFSGDDRNAVETIILSPVATALLDSDQVRGDSSVRIIRDDVEITGQGWTYDHRTKKVSITRNARVVFNAQMPDILK
jgi:hypothetical protein